MLGAVRGSLRRLRLGAERHGSDHSVSRILLKFLIGAQFVKAARGGEAFAAVAVFPILGGEIQRFGRVLHGLVNRVAGRDHARHVGKRHALAAVGVLMDQGDVMRHRFSPSASPPACRCSVRGKSRFGCGTITIRCLILWTNLWCEPRTDTCSKPSCSKRRIISRLSRSKGAPAFTSPRVRGEGEKFTPSPQNYPPRAFRQRGRT